ncbi:uncharacterized protein [Primulina eburnea]|uniref:uncharacterized protein n=1 Tax=Primulina eburnea TaxID=1245227 RepID=UPI003C6C24D1
MAKGNQANNQATQSSTLMSRNHVEDSSSPFYLQNGDHPGLVLVSHQLTGNNFNTWNRAMIMALTAKNKLGFVDRTIVQPPPDDLLYGAWLRCNSMVISWILNSVSRDIADSLMYIPTASEMWIDLRDRFLQSNAPRIFQIKRLLTDLHQGSMNISAYYTRLRTLWDELKDFQPIAPCHCGSMTQLVNFQNQECVLQFLMGLNDSYALIRAQILMMDPLPVIYKVFSLVIQEERQRSIHQNLSQITVVHSSNATAAKSSSSFNLKGGKFDKLSRNDKLICSHCHYTGHTVDKCYKLHGFPPGHPRFQQQQPRGHINAINAPHDGVNVPYADISNQSTSQLGDSLTPNQCQQLLTFLTAQLHLGSVSAQAQQQEEPSVSCFHGSSNQESDWDG